MPCDLTWFKVSWHSFLASRFKDTQACCPLDCKIIPKWFQPDSKAFCDKHNIKYCGSDLVSKLSKSTFFSHFNYSDALLELQEEGEAAEAESRAAAGTPFCARVFPPNNHGHPKHFGMSTFCYFFLAKKFVQQWQ